MRVLVIAPHPDDEVLGCGGTILNHNKDGCKVYLCIVTKAYTPDWSKEFLKQRPKEIRKANKILGIEKTYFLDFPTAKLDTIPQMELNNKISEIVKEVKPDVMYTPYKGDINKDHRLAFEASLVAARPANQIIKRVLSYETLSETEWGTHIESFIPNVYVDISETFETKIEAIKAYGSELKEYPHPRSIKIVKALAEKRGSEAGVNFAEAFVLIREIL